LDFFRARTFAQRALCAAAIFARDLADILRLLVVPVTRYTVAKAVSAAFNPDNCFSTWSRSFFSCFTSPDKLAINFPLGETQQTADYSAAGPPMTTVHEES
jgi:hypothetical protein